MTMQLSVERMAYGADAIAHREDGKAVFVSHAVPGDVIEADIISTGGSFDRARVVRVLEASPSRVKPLCPYASVCGGCPWASLSRDAQLAAKRAAVISSLVHIGHFDPDAADHLVRGCEAPSAPWGYRNKVELAYAFGGKKAIVGMHTSDQGQIVRVPSCALLNARHSSAVKAVSGALAYLSGSSDLGIERVGIRASFGTHDLEVALWGKPGAFPRAQAAKVLKEATHASSAVRVLMKGSKKARRVSGIEVLYGKGCWEERVAGQRMAFSAPSFFQVNTAGANRLIQIMLELLQPGKDDEVMDLYCGAGTFTLPLARQVSFVTAVESFGPAVRDLRRNLSSAHLDNVDVIGGDAGREFPDTEADLVVVDPPRAGLSEAVIQKLSDQSCRSIAYISCDPATLARDLARFRAQGSFEVAQMIPVDLFPQTFHVETIVLMSRVRRP